MPDWLTDALLDPQLERHQVNTLMITMLELYTKCKSDLHLFDFFELRFKSRDDFDTLHMTILLVMNTGLTVYMKNIAVFQPED